MKILEDFYSLKTKSELVYFPSITPDMMETVENVWTNPKKDFIVVEHPHILEKLSVKNFCTLKDEEWLNDEIINGYIRLVNKYLSERSGVATKGNFPTC